MKRTRNLVDRNGGLSSDSPPLLRGELEGGCKNSRNNPLQASPLIRGRSHQPNSALVLILTVIAMLLGSHIPVQAAAQACVNGHSSGKYDCKKITLQSRVPLSRFPGNPRAASNLWGYVDPDDGREYAIIGLWNGTGVVEVSDPIHPRIVGHIPGVNSQWREIKVYSVRNQSTLKWDAYVYVSTEGFGGGLQIIDLSKLPDRVSLAATNTDISTSHTLFISNIDYATGKKLPGKQPRLYVNGSDRAGLVVFGLKNPKNPKLLGEYSLTYVHDSYGETFTDSRAAQCAAGSASCDILFAWTGSDFRVLDVTNPDSIQVLSTLTYPQLGYAHSGWITADKQYLFNFDEFDEIQEDQKTRILTIDISDFLHPRISGTFNGRSKSIEHNGMVVGNKLYLSHYTRGLVIMDASEPNNLRQTGFFDTYPEDDPHADGTPETSHPGDGENDFHGAWGVYSFLPSGNILISDIERGLFILKEQ